MRAHSRHAIKEKINFMRAVSPYMSDRKYLTGLFALRLAALILGTVNPVFYKIMVDDVLISGKLNLLWVVVAGYVFTYFADAVIETAENYFSHKTYRRFILRLQEKLLDIIMRLSPGELLKYDAGDLKTRVRDGEMMEGFIYHNILEYVYSFATAAVTAVILLTIDYKLAIISFVTVPISFLMTKFLGKKKFLAAEGLRAEQVKFDGYIHSTLQNWKEIKILGLENSQNAVFDGYRGRVGKLFMKNQVFWYLNRTFISVKDFFVTKMNLYFIGGLLIFNDNLTVGSLLIFMVYFDRMFHAIETINDLDMRYQNDKPAITRIMETLAMEQDESDKTKLEPVFASLCFRDVTFSYPLTEYPAVVDAKFNVKRGERVAISGKSGCGKSTVIKLILGLYDDYTGEILINGIDVRDINKESVYRMFGVVMQEPYLFNLSIRENLLMSDGDADDESLWECLRLAAIDDFVASQPDGLDTIIGERGIKLSGGQRQRMAIARALLKNPNVLIFDEATSALDYVSEKAVHDSIRNMPAERTIILISHRPTSLALADTVISMQ